MPSFDRDRREPQTRLARAVLLALAVCLLHVASASAVAPNWLEPADLSKAGRNASNPTVAMDAAGNTTAVWLRVNDGGFPSLNLQMSTRDVGGTFTDPVNFALSVTDVQMAVAPNGAAVLAWQHLENPPGLHTIQVATRAPGGSFSTPVTVYTSTVIPQEVSVAIGNGGDVAVTWSRMDPNSGLDHLVCCEDPITHHPVNCPNPSFVEAAVRPAGGSFTPAQRISEPRGTAPGGETPTEQEEREKAESLLSASGASPAVDPAGNVTVVWSAFDGANSVIQTANRPAGGSFTAPAQVSESGENAGLAEIDVDAAGNAIASWVRNEGLDTIVQAAIKPPDGGFASLGNLSPAGEKALAPVLDVAPSGAATVVWRLEGPTEAFLQSSTRPAGGAFGPAVNVNSGKDNPQFHEVRISDEGDAIVVWSGENNADEIVRGAIRTAGSTAFGPPVAISQSSPDLLHPHPAMDAGGDATVVWMRDNGTHNIVQWAGYDADPPQFGAVSIPSSATVADTVQFSASASDVWPVGKPSFDFGDGAHADGNAVSHVYSAPGSYPVTVTVRDVVGRSSTRSATLLVKARNHFTIGKLKRNRKKGTATLTVTIPEPGTLVASGKGMKKAAVPAAKAGAVKVPIKAAGKSLRGLKAKGRLKLLLKIAYSPVGGDTSTQRTRVTLQKKLH